MMGFLVRTGRLLLSRLLLRRGFFSRRRRVFYYLDPKLVHFGRTCPKGAATASNLKSKLTHARRQKLTVTAAVHDQKFGLRAGARGPGGARRGVRAHAGTKILKIKFLKLIILKLLILNLKINFKKIKLIILNLKINFKLLI